MTLPQIKTQIFFILKLNKLRAVLRKTSAANGYTIEVQKLARCDYSVIRVK